MYRTPAAGVQGHWEEVRIAPKAELVRHTRGLWSAFLFGLNVRINPGHP